MEGDLLYTLNSRDSPDSADENLSSSILDISSAGSCNCLSRAMILAQNVEYLCANSWLWPVRNFVYDLQSSFERCVLLFACEYCADRTEIHVWLDLIFQNISILFLQLAKQMQAKHDHQLLLPPASSV